jgi:hypothetical protein
MCAIDGCESNDFTDVSHPRARKAHRCCECRRTIQPGETHLLVKALYDGYWSSDRTCAHCEAAGSWLDAMCGGWLTHGLDEELADHWDEYGTLGLGRIMVARRQHWRGVTPEQVRAWATESVERIKRSVAA